MNKRIYGEPVSRKDGVAKVTGRATYSAEYRLSNTAYGYLLTSRIASGRVTSIDAAAAEKMPGVLGVFTRANLPAFYAIDNDWTSNAVPERVLPLADDRVSYARQPLGLVVAETYEQARAAARMVKIEYEAAKPAAALPALEKFDGKTSERRRGDLAAGLAQAAKKIEAVYRTANEVHCQMEPHALVADWQGESLTIYEANQWIAGSRSLYAQIFGIEEENVRVVSRYIGGTFGGKAFPWAFSFLTAAAARELKRPVKTALTRPQMFAQVGHRTETEQKIVIGASADGRLTALGHEVLHHTSHLQDHDENASNVSHFVYAAPHLLTRQRVARLNVGTPTWLRAPGETPGMFALESAMDELAYELDIDPVELRLRNHTDAHPESNKPFSAKFLRECYRVGAARFGWEKRAKRPRAMTRDDLLIGYGMASATFPGARAGAKARARLLPDGRAEIGSATVDLGTGSYTVFAQVAADALGIPVDRVTFKLGDSSLPPAFVSGGSMTAATVGPAVLAACRNALQKALNLARGDENSPLFGAKPEEIETNGVRFRHKTSGRTDSVAEILKRRGMAAVTADGDGGPAASDKFEYQSWGAHFCEVAVDEQLGRVRVARWVAAINVGKILNLKTATSQVTGSVVMGIGTALSEEMHYDPVTARPAVFDLAGYHVAVQADVPDIEVEFVGEPDLNFNPLGVRGVGEVGITGVTAAIANAVYHATGKRLRELPLTPDKII